MTTNEIIRTIETHLKEAQAKKASLDSDIDRLRRSLEALIAPTELKEKVQPPVKEQPEKRHSRRSKAWTDEKKAAARERMRKIWAERKSEKYSRLARVH